jgi:hypothetical protein
MLHLWSSRQYEWIKNHFNIKIRQLWHLSKVFMILHRGINIICKFKASLGSSRHQYYKSIRGICRDIEESVSQEYSRHQHSHRGIIIASKIKATLGSSRHQFHIYNIHNTLVRAIKAIWMIKNSFQYRNKETFTFD